MLNLLKQLVSNFFKKALPATICLLIAREIPDLYCQISNLQALIFALVITVVMTLVNKPKT